MKKISIIVVALAAVAICSCKKSGKDKYSSSAAVAADQAAEAAKVAIKNWEITNGADWKTNSQFSNDLAMFPVVTKMAITNEVFVEIGRAGLFLKQLHDEDLLPGVTKDEHGNMTSDTLDSVVSNNAVAITFPALRTFHLVKNGETSTNNYTLVKQTKDSEWKLQKAWLTDSNGQIIKEWPVK